MNYAKTGQLIAARRKEYDLTQKQLGEKLSVSDRTISKWERGIGFPDISLLESLADVLNLSVIELMHGEKGISENAAAESGARDTLRSLNGEFQRRVKRVRKYSKIITTILMIVAVLSVAALLFYLRIDNYEIRTKDVTLPYAVSKMPDIIITGEEYALAEEILNMDAVREAIANDVLIEDLDESVSADLYGKLHGNEKPPDTIIISVFHETILIDYTIEDYRFILQFSSADRIIKCATQYDKDLNIKHCFENDNNIAFKEACAVKMLIPPKH